MYCVSWKLCLHWHVPLHQLVDYIWCNDDISGSIVTYLPDQFKWKMRHILIGAHYAINVCRAEVNLENSCLFFVLLLWHIVRFDEDLGRSHTFST
jgi:hypothetical protein